MDEEPRQARTRQHGGVALLLIDLINPLDFDGSETVIDAARSAAHVAGQLRAQADALRVPTLYVNDNHGHWHAEQSAIVARCTSSERPAHDVVRAIAPRPQDYFVVKPHLSGFYATTLPVLLPKLGVSRLVLAGIATDICILFTAADAHMRDYDLWVPRDAVASEGADRTAWALDIMQKSMDAEIAPTSSLTLREWVARGAGAADA